MIHPISKRNHSWSKKAESLKLMSNRAQYALEPWSKDEVMVEAEGIDERHPERLVMSQSGNNVTLHY